MKIFSVLILSLIIFSVAQADFTSTSFTLENPLNVIEGGKATSSSFQYFSSTGQTTSGQSTSSSFAQNAGFLYFPTATSPVVSATAGNAQVVLTWTAAVGALANITSYELGTSTTSGGTFIYVSVGDVLTSTKTSLTNGTLYYFKVRSYATGILLSESAEVSATPVAPVSPPPSSGGGGGGGGGGGAYIPPSTSSTTGATFSGRAFPKSTVTLLKDAQIVATTLAGSDANFSINLSGLSGGNYIFSVYGEDSQGIRSSLLTFPVSITSGSNTSIGGIFLAPTIAVNKSEVKRGDNIAIFGQSTPVSEITINVNSDEPIFVKTPSDKNGVYLYNFDTSVIEYGQHSAKSKVALNGEISSFSQAVNFAVGTKNVDAPAITKASKQGDLNDDKKVNLIDFSISPFWYKKKNPPAKVDLNHDGIVNLVDFSILAYHWTG